MSRSVPFLLTCTLIFLAGCSAGPRLNVAPDRAEFPYGESIDVDGRIGPNEWAAARRLEVVLPGGRDVEILMQRDRHHFQFAFVGLGEPGPRTVVPEVLMDLWGNRSSTWDDNDWWIRIGRDDCWARGGWGEGDCAFVLPGLIANNFPLGRDEAIEIKAEFRAMRFDESYEGQIGLAFRFVDETGVPVAIWPLRAEVEDPGSWAPIALRH